MSTLLKVLVALGVALPLAAFVAGSLVATADRPPTRERIIIQEVSTPTGPAPADRRGDQDPGPKPPAGDADDPAGVDEDDERDDGPDDGDDGADDGAGDDARAPQGGEDADDGGERDDDTRTSRGGGGNAGGGGSDDDADDDDDDDDDENDDDRGEDDD